MSEPAEVAETEPRVREIQVKAGVKVERVSSTSLT